MSFDDLLLSYRDYYGTYHHHKEQMAYSVTVLFLSAATATILKGRALFGSNGPTGLEVFVAVAAVILCFVFVGWQFRRREIAADVVRACTVLLAKRLAGSVPSPDVELKTWHDISLPGELVTALTDISSKRDLLGGGRASEAITYIVMTVWTVAAAASLSP